MTGLVVHGHDAIGMDQCATARQHRLTGDQRFQNRFVAVDEQRQLIVFAQRPGAAGDDGLWPTVTAHGIHRNHNLLRSGARRGRINDGCVLI